VLTFLYWSTLPSTDPFVIAQTCYYGQRSSLPDKALDQCRRP
jgi:hypothetical protein